MKVKFWGVRGSLTCPGKNTIKYGGNTACIQINVEQDYQLIIDAGTGLRELGNALLADPKIKKPISAHIFLTHTHWDHILGFPFFKPIYIKGTHLYLYGPQTSPDMTLAQTIGGQMNHRYFPVEYTDLEATIQYANLSPGHTILPGNVKVSYIQINHPIVTFGYRIEYKGKSIGTCFDHEPFTNSFLPKNSQHPELVKSAEENDAKLAEFYEGVDLLIHDAQYTSQEYNNKYIGWGHSSFDYALQNAVRCHAKQLIFFHHDMERTDSMLDEIEKSYSKQAKKLGITAHVAIENREIIL